MSSPDLLIVFGSRGLLSLAGIVLIVGGVWCTYSRCRDLKGNSAKEADSDNLLSVTLLL